MSTLDLDALIDHAASVTVSADGDVGDLVREALAAVRNRVFSARGIWCKYPAAEPSLERLASQICPSFECSQARLQATGISAVLLEPTVAVRLRTPPGAPTELQRFAFATAVGNVGGDELAVGLARVDLVPSKNRRVDPVSIEIDLQWVDGNDRFAAANLLAGLYLESNMDDRAELVSKSAPRVAWLGGSHADCGHTLPDDWKCQMQAVCAARGFGAVVLEHPYRNLADAGTRLNDLEPDVVLCWSQYARVSQDQMKHVAGDVIWIDLSELGFNDAVVEACLNLDAACEEILQRGIRDSEIEAADPPESGEVRYYKKIGGSAVGDKLVRLGEPCGHDNWRSVQGAERARKGILRLEDARIRALWRCNECCGGSVWRVRFD